MSATQRKYAHKAPRAACNGNALPDRVTLPTMASPPSRTRLALEFTVLFLALPLLAAWQGPVAKRWVIPQLLLFAALLLAVLWRDPSFDRRQLRSVPANLHVVLRRIAVVLLLAGAALLTITIASRQVRVFAFAYEHPFLWLAIVLLYPLTSAAAQELIFRVFIFHRYGALFSGNWTLILASAGSFALAHLQLGNVVAPALSLVGGVRFAYTYANTRSLPIVVLEHGLWGDWIFTIGLGAYFYGGHF